MASIPASLRWFKRAQREVEDGVTNRHVSESFIERLRSVSPRLRVRWDGRTERWQVWEMTYSGRGPQLVCLVEDENHNHRPLDNRILDKLCMMDSARISTNHDRVYAALLQHEKDEEDRRRRADERALEEAAKLEADWTERIWSSG